MSWFGRMTKASAGPGEEQAATSQDTTSGAGGQNNAGAQVSGADMRSQMTLHPAKAQTNEMSHKGKVVGHVIKMKDGSYVAHHAATGSAGSYPQQQQAATAVAESHAAYNNSGGNTAATGTDQ
jgi:hypothetical protein